MSEYTIERGTWADVAHLRIAASRENVPMVNRPQSLWWVARCGDEVVGCAALRPLGGDPRRLRLGSCFVLPAHRGRGIGQSLIAARVNAAIDSGARVVDTYAYRPETFARMGWAPGHRFEGTGSVHMTWRRGG